jgi:1-phosphofructokinase
MTAGLFGSGSGDDAASARVCPDALFAPSRDDEPVATTPPHVTVFGPDPLLSVTIEPDGAGSELHVHAAGQGVWVSRMVGELETHPVLCCLAGGETGRVLGPLLAELPGEQRVVEMAGTSGSYVVDHRSGARVVVAAAPRPALHRHEVDDLVAVTCAAALGSAVLVLCNPYPIEGLPDDIYATLVADTRASGVPVIVDLSTPRLDRTLSHRPDLVKLNDWELAEWVSGPVDGRRALDGARRLIGAGAGAVAVTRAEGPILVVPGDGDPFELVPPAFPRGYREGCGDTMTGAIAAGWAHGLDLTASLVLGAAAGSGNFLRRGLGTGTRDVVRELAGHVEVRSLSAERKPAAAAETAG